MKRLAIFTALCLITLMSANSKVNAQDITIIPEHNDLLTWLKPKEEPKPQPTPTIKTITIAEGDTLTTLAEAQGTSVARLWAKNTDLTSPDIITPGQSLVVPQNDEVLPDRPLPAPPVIAPLSPSIPVAGGAIQPKGSSAGNTYAYGYCTWYAKNRRPDLPNNLGNADTWFYMAAAQGFSVGDEPRVGAVAAARGYMHVAIVEAVDGNKVLVSEMNYAGLGVVSSRWSKNSEWHYIY